MKTINYIFKLTLFIMLILPFVSCQEEGGRIRNPIPSENPVYFTAEAQTMFITVKKLTGIDPENRETDKSYYNENNFPVVENDWITITWMVTEFDKKSVKIVVKENTDVNSRTYNLPMKGRPGNATLKIIQAGKAGN